MTSPQTLEFLDCASKPPEERTNNDLVLIFEYLKNFETLATFKTSTIQSMSRTIRLKIYHKNNPIFKTGELISCWFILLNGSIKIDDQILKPISKFGRRTHFENIRSTNCTAIEESEILITDYQDVEAPAKRFVPHVDNNVAMKLNYEELEKLSNSQETSDVIVLSDNSTLSQPREQGSDNECPEDAEIICLSDDQWEKQLNSNIPKLEHKEALDDDLECIELCTIDKKIPLGRTDFDMNDQDVKDRWRVKKRADPNVNLSISNYKQRAFGHQPAPFERKFKSNIYFDESVDETNLSYEQNLKLDQEALERKFNYHLWEFKQSIENYEIFFRKNVAHLDQKYEQNIEEILHHFSNEKDKLVANNDNWYQNELNKLDLCRRRFLDQAQKVKNQTERALRDLFNSGCYVKGKFSEYLVLETKQPSARRRAYFDTGKRYMLLPKNQIKNILIEDMIYEYYYGKP